jgi:protein-tyrosine-phosphatase
VITLCDSAAAKPCPIFVTTPARPLATLHWGLADPASGAASFEDTYHKLTDRIEQLTKETSCSPTLP